MGSAGMDSKGVGMSGLWVVDLSMEDIKYHFLTSVRWFGFIMDVLNCSWPWLSSAVK